MKKTTSILVIALGITTTLFAQEKKKKQVTPTDAAQSGFQQKFPGATAAKWESEGADFEVKFTQKSTKMSAIFSVNGTWKETETTIPLSGIPAAATAYLQQHYSGQKIKEAARIEQADGTTIYEAETGSKDILFDASGNFMKEAKD